MQAEITLRQAAQQALEALEKGETKLRWAAISALKQALAEPDSDYERGFVDGMNLQTKGSVDKAVNRIAEPEQEPVAWMVYTLDGKSVCVTDNPDDFGPEHKALPLYTAPTPRKPLTNEEIWKCLPPDPDELAFARAIERAHGIGGEA